MNLKQINILIIIGCFACKVCVSVSSNRNINRDGSVEGGSGYIKAGKYIIIVFWNLSMVWIMVSPNPIRQYITWFYIDIITCAYPKFNTRLDNRMTICPIPQCFIWSSIWETLMGGITPKIMDQSWWVGGMVKKFRCSLMFSLFFSIFEKCSSSKYHAAIWPQLSCSEVWWKWKLFIGINRYLYCSRNSPNR